MIKQAAIIAGSGCPYCEKAKELLQKEGYTIWYSVASPGNTLWQFLLYAGFTTVPQIFIDGRHIGGYTELEKLFNQEGVE